MAGQQIVCGTMSLAALDALIGGVKVRCHTCPVLRAQTGSTELDVAFAFGYSTASAVNSWLSRMGRHRFKTFLKKRRWSNTLARHFVDDAEADASLPDAESWEQLETYLKEQEAVRKALDAAMDVWEQYDKERQSRTL